VSLVSNLEGPPFVKLTDLIEQTIGVAREEFEPTQNNTEDGWVAFVILRQLARSGYEVSHPSTGFVWPPNNS
jgi:hypothetical protein